MRYLLLSASVLLLAVAVLLPAAPALAERGERLLCHDLDGLAFHEELSPGVTAPADYDAALQSNWLGVRYAVGPESIAVPFGRRLLPDSLFLRLIRGHFGI